MKHSLLLSFFLLIFFGSRAQTLLQQQSFEGTGTDAQTANGYTATTVATTSSNIYFYNATLPVPGYLNSTQNQLSTVTNISGIAPGSSGTHFWASESVRRDATNTVRGNPAANLTLNSVNVAGKTGLYVTVALADASGPATGSTATNPEGTGGNTVPRWEGDDYVRVQYRFDGTGNWNTIGQFVGDDPGTAGASGRLRRDANLDGRSSYNTEPNSPILTQTLTDYTFSIPGSGNTLEVRVQIDDDGFSEEFGFDNIRVYGLTATSSPPVLASLEAASLPYAEGQAATPLSSSLTVSDSDSPNQSSATVRISLGNDASEDRLAFSGDGTTGNITAGAYDASNGLLTLTSAGSTATLAQWQNALRRVTYQNIDAVDASTGTRTVTFTITDPAGVSSNSPTRTITLTTALDAPSSLPYTETFETEGEGTRYASNHYFSQNAAQFQRTTTNPVPNGATFSNIAGSAYWIGVNTAGGIGLNPTGLNNGTLTTKRINATSYANLHFQIRLGASVTVSNGNAANWRTTDYFQLFYRPAGSSTWTAFGLFRGTSTTSNGVGQIRQDSNPTGTGAPTGTALSATLQNVDFTLPTALNGQVIDFQLVLANSDAINVFAFDQIQVTGAPLVAPSVTTTPPTGVTLNSVVLGGNVTADGGAIDTERGVVYSPTNTTPTTSNTKVQIGTGAGIFSQTITGLTAGTLYYVRAYATNSAGTSYGSTVTFTTTPNPPVVSSPANGTLTNNVAPTYSGIAQANSFVTVYVDGSSIGSTTATGGNWSLTQPTTLANGSHTVYARALIGSSAASANSNTNSFTVDVSAPTVTSVSVPANGTYRTGQPLSFTVNFSENVTVTGTPQLGLTIGSTSRQASYQSGSGSSPLVFSYTVQNGELDSDGIALASALTLNGGTIRDVATNTATITLSGVGSTAGVLVDAVAPTVSISSSGGPNGATLSTSPIPFTLTFSESVTGLVATEITVTNGILANFTSSGTTYTFNVTPSANGVVTVNVAANVAQDAAGNSNTASGSYSFTYQPPLTITNLTPSSTTICAGGVVGFTATLGNVGSTYTYTLGDGQNAISGSGTGTNFSQSLTVSTAGLRSFTLTIVSSDGQVATATTSVTVTSSMYTLKAGNWTDGSVWSCGRVPLLTDAVTLHHAVSLPESYQGQALRVSYSASGRLLFGNGSRLRLGGN